jgi:hypothetical protein
MTKRSPPHLATLRTPHHRQPANMYSTVPVMVIQLKIYMLMSADVLVTYGIPCHCRVVFSLNVDMSTTVYEIS